MYQCRNFIIQQLVPPHVYEEHKDQSWQLLDERALLTLDTLHDTFGITTVNDWHTGGSRKWSGLRTKESPWYSEFSQHTYGRAFDCIFLHKDAQSVRNYILLHKTGFPCIAAIETGVDWLHFDVRNCSPILLFNK